MFQSWSLPATSSALNWSEFVLILLGAVLVVGLIGEYPKRWEPYAKVFMVLVIIGVGGELLADAAIFILSNHLQVLSEVEVARLGDDVAHANLRAASAEQEAARLGKEAEDERTARLRLEARVADRRLPDDQRNFLVDCLKASPGQITIEAAADNSEAYRYAQVWRELFVSAHWNTENEQHIPIELFAIGGSTWSGVRLNIHGTVTAGQMSLVEGSPEETLYVCLKKTHGIGAAVIPYTEIATGHATLLVSDKPKPE